jgi:hypothetical protein
MRPAAVIRSEPGAPSSVEVLRPWVQPEPPQSPEAPTRERPAVAAPSRWQSQNPQPLIQQDRCRERSSTQSIERERQALELSWDRSGRRCDSLGT